VNQASRAAQAQPAASPAGMPAADPESLMADIQSADQRVARPRARRDVSLDALVEEYESQSQRLRLGDDGEIEYEPKRKNDQPAEKPKRGQQLWVEDAAPASREDDEERSIPVPSTSNERNLAALLHAFPLLGLFFGTLSGGLGVPIMMLITAGVYFHYKDRSEFMRRNAWEALKNQLVGTLGFAALVTAIPIVATVLIVVSAITIVGILLIPFIVIAMVLGILASLALPIVSLALSGVGAYRAYNGEVYRYPYRKWLGRARRRVPQEAQAAFAKIRRA
jgi:uncharacterized Tic20 family protein